MSLATSNRSSVTQKLRVVSTWEHGRFATTRRIVTMLACSPLLTRRVLSDQAVHRLSDEIGMAEVPGVLLDEIEQHPAEVRGLPGARHVLPDVIETTGGECF